MPTLSRIRVELTGAGIPGGGLSTFYVAGAAPTTGPIHDFYAALIGGFPSGVTITVASSGDTFNDADGSLIGTWTDTPTAPVVATGTGQHAGGSGAYVSWTTNGVVARRRVKGRTYLVPLSGGVFDSDGTLSASSLVTIRDAADDLVSALGSELRIWSRPFPGDPDAEPPIPARVGSSFPIVAATVPDRAGILKSRRG